MSQTIKEIGEQGLLKIIKQFCPSNIIGDDGAVLATDKNKLLVTTTDVLVENVHFSKITTSSYDIGWRSCAANLSDIAAMGALPLGLTVGLSLPPNTQVNYIKEIYQGLAECCQQYNCDIIGGDICKSSTITIAITALGEVLPNQVISRFTAKAGDVILVTGSHGGSKGGLELLLDKNLGKNLTLVEQQELIKMHQRPQPRLDIINSLWDNHPNITISGMDSSDGLADAIIQICSSSKVGANININSIPIPESLRKLAGEQKALEYALYGGEDFELVLCLPSTSAQNLTKKLGKDCKIIGEIIEENEIILQNNINLSKFSNLTLEKGFQHFQE